jgi:hypothetical protein
MCQIEAVAAWLTSIHDEHPANASETPHDHGHDREHVKIHGRDDHDRSAKIGTHVRVKAKKRGGKQLTWSWE